MMKKACFSALSTRVVYQKETAVSVAAQGIQHFEKSFAKNSCFQSFSRWKAVYHGKMAIKTDRMRDTAIFFLKVVGDFCLPEESL